jgi:methionine-rich copper-binding protein CopC
VDDHSEWKVTWALIICLALFAGQGLRTAEAHAELVSAYPAPGATLDDTPAEIRLTFSERIGLGSQIQLFGPQFRAVAGVQAGLDPAAPEQLRAFPPQLPPDIYTVEWSAVSVDGHEVSGSYAFAVTAAPPAAAAATQWRVGPWLLAALLLAVLAVCGAAWELARRKRAGRRRDAAGLPVVRRP